ncbi:Ig-like domain-containing protein [Peribacillus asahii]|uniref:Ig-like domain-containing protein n=1 Tax=Peribacillus asahii TaxID=228899 RepID=UPI0020795ACC|nr:Ig-like domain-containing protein [Peribacillus asahii]USK70047.1 Ig-like domain-containing protein [Peribacillus asahii]
MYRNLFKFMALLFILTVSVNVTVAEAASEYEENNSIATATPISFESNKVIVDGVLATRYDDDYFSFTLTKPGKVVVKVNRNLNTRYNVKLYNAQQEELESYATSYNVDKGTQELFSQGLDAGTYYVKVEHYDGNGENVPYKLQVDYTQSNYYEKEFNNERASANMIALNKKYYGWADYNSDYYVFEVPSSGEIKVGISRSLNTRYEVSLYNSAGDEMEAWYTYYGSESMGNVVHTGLPKGIYYLKVRTYDGDRYNALYGLKVDFKANSLFETEDNDSTSLADSLNVNKSMNGVISYSSDTDYYSLNLTKNMNLSLYLTNPKDTGFYVEVFNQNNSVYQYLYTEYGTGKLKNISNLNLKKGLYYIKVRHNKGEDKKVPYTLKVAQRDTTPPSIPTVNKVTTKSTKVTGKAEKGATVYVYRGSKKLGQVVASSSSGSYSVKIAKQKRGTSLNVYAKDKAGNKSQIKTIKVQ